MTEMKFDELASLIKKAGEGQRIAEFEYPFVKGFFVLIGFASKFSWQQIREAAREVRVNPRTRQQEEQMNEVKMRKEYSRLMIKGWKGLTMVSLDKLIPGLGIEVERKADPTAQIEFNADMAYLLMQYSSDFENWVVDTAQNPDNFASVAQRKKEQLDNLS
jgi:hypothetical protein